MHHELARYAFIDSIMCDYLRHHPGHPLNDYLKGQRNEMRGREPYPYFQFHLMPDIWQHMRPGMGNEVCNLMVQVLEAGLFEVFERNRIDAPPAISASFEGKYISYIYRDSFAKLDPDMKVKIVTRELVPHVIKMIEATNG